MGGVNRWERHKAELEAARAEIKRVTDAMVTASWLLDTATWIIEGSCDYKDLQEIWRKDVEAWIEKHPGLPPKPEGE